MIKAPRKKRTSKKATPDTLTERGFSRRRALLEHATDLFIENGYERASIREVIERAGGSRSLIYQCFKNKQGLFLACLQLTVDDVYSTYVNEAHNGVSLDEELVNFGRIFLEHLTTRRSLGLLRLIHAESRHFPEIGAWYWREGVFKSWACFARVMGDYVDLPEDELLDASRCYINLLKGGLVEECLANPNYEPDTDRIMNEVIRAAGWIADALAVRQARYERAVLRAIEETRPDVAKGYDFSNFDFAAIERMKYEADVLTKKDAASDALPDEAHAQAARAAARYARTGIIARLESVRAAARLADMMPKTGEIPEDEKALPPEALAEKAAQAAVAAQAAAEATAAVAAAAAEAKAQEEAKKAAEAEAAAAQTALLKETAEAAPATPARGRRAAAKKAESAPKKTAKSKKEPKDAGEAEAPKPRTKRTCFSRITAKIRPDAFAKPLPSELRAQKYREERDAKKAAKEAGGELPKEMPKADVTPSRKKRVSLIAPRVRTTEEK